jgi:hypothetical protein
MSSSIPPVPSSAPGTSKPASPERRGDSPLASRYAAVITTAQIGTLMYSTHRQPGPAEMTPPRNTPKTPEKPPIAPHAPSALTRSVPALKLVVRMDSAAGVIRAAPIPWASRAPTSVPAFGAAPPRTEVIANTAVPMTSVTRRPSRSASRPPSSRNPP